MESLRTLGGAPLCFPEEDRAWVESAVQAVATVYRPLAPGLAALAESMPTGPEREYVAGFSELWPARDLPEGLAAQARRDAAASGLHPVRIDALLHRCRAAVATR